MIVKPWEKVLETWRRAGIPIRPGVSLTEIESFESKYNVAAPVALREYFRAADGSSTGRMDSELFRFWPLSEVVPVHEELDERGGVVYPDRFAHPDCFFFADHLLSSWLYAVELTLDPDQPAPVYRVRASDAPREQMSPSFAEFMGRYANKPSSIL